MNERLWRWCAISSLAAASVARADGGTVRLSQVSGPYRVTIFTSPVPLRAGPVDVSVIVSDAATGEQFPDANVAVRVSPLHQHGSAIVRPATVDAATTKLFRMASFELSQAGEWSVEVEVDGFNGRARVATQVSIAPPLPRWMELSGWIATPFWVIALFVANAWLRLRRGLPPTAIPTRC